MATTITCDKCAKTDDVKHFVFSSSVAADTPSMSLLSKIFGWSDEHKADHFFRSMDLCIDCRTQLVKIFINFTEAP